LTGKPGHSLLTFPERRLQLIAFVPPRRFGNRLLVPKCIYPPQRYLGFLSRAINLGVRAILDGLHVCVETCAFVGHHRVLLAAFGQQALQLSLQLIVEAFKSLALL
jgi:hypothetical protein